MSKIYNIPLSFNFLHETALIIANIQKNEHDLSEYTVFLPNRRSRKILKTKIKSILSDRTCFLPQLKIISDEFLFEEIKITFLITNLLKKTVTNVPLNTLYALSESILRLLKDFVVHDINYKELSSLVPDHLMEYWEHTIAMIESCMCCSDIEQSLNFVKEKFKIFTENIAENNLKIISAGIGNTNGFTRKFLQAVLQSQHGIILLTGNEIKNSQNYIYNQKLLNILGNNSNIQVHEYAEKHYTKSPHNITFAEFSSISEEAFAVATQVRKAIHEQKTIMIVTNDKKLATKIKHELLRWNIIADDSSGEKFCNTQSGILISLIIDAINSDFQTYKMLCILKFSKIYKKEIQALELFLRTQEKVPSIFFDSFSLWQRHINSTPIVLDKYSSLCNLIHEFQQKIINIHTTKKLFSEWTHIIQDITIIIAIDSLLPFNSIIHKFLNYGDVIGNTSFEEYSIFLKNHILTTDIRQISGYTKDVVILGLLEAQLLDADMIIIAGANEACISSHNENDFWLSNSMRQSLNIQTLETKNEFIRCVIERLSFKKNILITRAKKTNGIQQQIYSYIDKIKPIDKSSELTDLINHSYQLLHRHEFKFIAPKPTLSYRPNKFSVTDIDILRNNPYIFYAKKILKLKELHNIHIAKNMRGNYIHKVMEIFFNEPKEKQNIENLHSIANYVLHNMWLDKTDFGIYFFGLDNIFSFVIQNLNNATRSLTEIKGEYTINITKDYACTISCIVDRIDILDNNCISIIDYKTGNTPTKQQIKDGLKPQLPIEALIALNDGFKIGKKDIISLSFVLLNGKNNGGKIQDIYTGKEEIKILSDETLIGLKNLINQYNILGIAYNINPDYKYEEKYLQLARVKEWHNA